MGRLTDGEKELIMSLRETGESYRRIAITIHRDCSTVRKFCLRTKRKRVADNLLPQSSVTVGTSTDSFYLTNESINKPSEVANEQDFHTERMNSSPRSPDAYEKFENNDCWISDPVLSNRVVGSDEYSDNNHPNGCNETRSSITCSISQQNFDMTCSHCNDLKDYLRWLEDENRRLNYEVWRCTKQS